MTAKIYLKPEKGNLPESRPDLANCIKAIEDGLQYGGIIAPKGRAKRGNDKQIVQYGGETGIYPGEPERVEIQLESIAL
jgi:Holliday junction resolvase RusA-like endonuclease